MKKLFTLFCLLTYSFINYGQTTYFDQDFLANTTISSYASIPASANQFTEIPTVTGITTTITNGRYQMAKSGTTAVNYRFGRGIDFASEPKSLYCQFNFGVVTAAAVTKNNAIVLSLGGTGIIDGATVPTAANTYAKLNFNLIAGGLTFQVNDGTTNSANFTGNQDITYVMNNTGATFTYIAPDGTNETLGNDLFDVWVGATKVFNDRPVLTGTQTIKRFRFDLTHDAAVANAPTLSFDNFLMRDVTGSLLVNTNVATPDSMLVKYVGTGAVKNVGLGTATPAAKLEINAPTINSSGVRLTQLKSTSPAAAPNGKVLSVNVNGDIVLVRDTLATSDSLIVRRQATTGNLGLGLGTTAPAAKLEVKAPTINSSGVRLTQLKSTSPAAASNGKVLSVNANGDIVLVKDSLSAGAGTSPWTTTGANISSSNTGNVGIGIATPVEKLDVVGNIKTTGTLKVGAYTLPSTDGANGQVLQTNGTGTLNWQTPSGGFALPALTTGSLLFSNGTTISQNNSKIFWDNTNFRLGIGTITPTQALDITGGAKISALAGTGNRMVITDANGILSSQVITTGADNLGNHTATQNILLNGFSLTNNGTGGGLAITNTGNIGIGIATPVEKLDVVGNIKTTGTLKVGAYTLPSTDGASGQVLQTNGTGTLNWQTPSGGFALPALTTGSLLFSNGTTIAQNNSKIFWDNTNFRLGIGTITPAQALDVTGGAKISSLAGTGSRMVITDANGILSSQAISTGADNLGNHTATQNINLSTFKITGNGGTSGLSIANDGTISANSLAGTGSRMVVTDANGNLSSQAIVLPSSADWVKLPNNKVQNTNPVMIGTFLAATAFPTQYNLYVKKGILTEEVKIAGEGSIEWADYVFAKKYKLRSLSEVENFVKINKHLPGVPSAEEVSKDGINVGKMEAKLLEKIEELTLYMIDMKKENAKLKKRLKRLEDK